jgi:hypothetical protein
MLVEGPVPGAHPDPVPKPGWLTHRASAWMDTEQEVEMHFASPLFREGLRHSDEQEATRFRIQ